MEKKSRVFFFILFFQHCTLAFEWPTITYRFKASCSANQTYNPSMLQCETCQNPLTVPSPSGIGCTCIKGSKVIQDTGYYGRRTGVPSVECQACTAKANQAVSQDGKFCISCPPEATITPNGGCQCPSGHILTERGIDGQILPTAKCIACSQGTQPSPDGRTCQPCHFLPMLKEQPLSTRKCNCSLVGGLCLPPNYLNDGGISFLPSSQANFVRFPISEINVDSAFFKEHFEAAAYMCTKFHNVTACQLLGNLCALSLHDGAHPTCSVLHNLIFLQRYQEVPHVFYESQTTQVPIKNEDITTVYKLRKSDVDATQEPRSHRLNLTFVAFSLAGEFQEMGTVNGAMFQMCNGSFQEFDSAFNFGTRYGKKCKIPAHILASSAAKPTTFYDLYIPYKSETSTAGSSNKLFAVPMMILNKGQNRDKNNDKKELTTRFFLVDTVTGVPVGKDQKIPLVIRYLKKFKIEVNMLNTKEFPDKAGRIFPPIISIEYGEVTQEDVAEGKKVDFEFSVTYRMAMREARKDIEIAMGVLSAFAVLWSAMETWSWNRRSGKSGIDPFTLAKLLANTCGNLAHVFLSVVFFTSLYWFIFFKQQNFIHCILPTPDQEKLIQNYVISIFALKIVDIIHLLASQMSADIFLIDWEQPKPGQEMAKGSNVASTKEMSVSAWRTYLVANEWNEIQTLRKINHSLQVVLVVLVLKVFGMENLATADPLNVFDLNDDEFHSEFSYVCRFALGVSVYVGIALLQIFFWCGLYNNLIEDKLQQFTDVCSLANISLFAMAENNFGYYIHGKSAHGFSDTDMATLLEQMQREAEDLCGHRGLLAGTDDQTFSMALPAKLRNYYDKVVTPATSMASGSTAGPRAHKLTGTAVQQMVQAYGTMNKFLTRFLEHALKDLDFEVKDRLFLESVMDIEFQDFSVSEKAVFYKDSGHSFDAILFYGHEFSLIIFDIMIFSFVDLFAQDFLLAGIVTYFVGKVLVLIRQIGGKSNLAKKTLIDKRFLI